ncbi:MAG: S1 RNA-binding domain-containing protein [Clostridiales bacterium]|nr:S1 RNA-binding domain-containing protein [Clostridiales bacterium]
MSLEAGSIVKGIVTGITNFGAFIDLGEGKTGLIHISEVANDYVKNVNDFLKEGQALDVKVLAVGKDGKISLSAKQAEPEGKSERPYKRSVKPSRDNWKLASTEKRLVSFDDKLSNFLKESEENMKTLKSKNKNKGSRKGNGYVKKCF